MTQLLKPMVYEFAGKKDDTNGVNITSATYVDVGNIEDFDSHNNLTLFLEEIGGVEAVKVRVLVDPEYTKPANTSGMYILTDAAGADIEYNVGISGKLAVETNGLSAKWLALQAAKAGVGASTTLRAIGLRGAIIGSDKTTLKVPKLNIASVPVALTATEQIIGGAINVAGLTNLTLFVENSDATVNATLKVYLSYKDAQPSNMLSENALANAAGAISITAPANKKIAVNLGNVSANWLAVSGQGNGADVKVFLVGSVGGGGGF